MTSRDRSLFAFFGFAVAAGVAGCSGGGGGSPGPGATPTPTPLVVNSRPLQSGDTFSYAGTTTKSFVYSGTSPEPASTTVYAVAQSLAVTGPTAYDGSSGTFDVKDTETDTSPLSQLGLTTNTYYALLPRGATTNLVTYGYTSTDTNGESLAVTIPNVNDGNGLLDELPEAKGQTWSNTPAETVNESSPGGLTSVRTVNADGTYSDTTTFPAGSIYPTSNPALPPATEAVITQNADGSGSYVFYDNPGTGSAPQSYLEIDVATPIPASSGAPAQIPITSTQPQASAAPVSLDVPLWYPQPLALYTETDTDSGTVAIPTACNVPASFGKNANAVVQTIAQYDTIVGTEETFSQTNYVIPTYGLACVALNDRLEFFYDYTGQSGLAAGPTVNVTATSTLPIETETIATTLGLTASNASSASVRRAAAATAPTATGLRVTNARSNFLALVEREKQRRKAVVLQAIRQAVLERLHR
jgi:hypothetical protein